MQNISTQVRDMDKIKHRICVDCCQGIIFRFSCKKFQSQQKPAKKVTHFTIQFHAKNLTLFTSLNSLNIIKIYSCNTAKNRFLVGVRKCFCTASFLDAQELHSQSIWKSNVCLFL